MSEILSKFESEVVLQLLLLRAHRNPMPFNHP